MANVISYLKEKLSRQYKNHSWNYRIVRRTTEPIDLSDKIQYPSEDIFGIVEMYYENDKIVSFCTYSDGEELNRDMYGYAKHMSPFGNTMKDLRGDLELMLKAFDKPVVGYEWLMANVKEKKD